jgi:hypothetical protein
MNLIKFSLRLDGKAYRFSGVDYKLCRRMGIDTIFVKHYHCVMKNVTITLDEELARWARIRAAELDTSVSRLVAELLREKMVNTKSFDKAMERYFTQEPVRLKRPGSKYPRRHELHDR